MKRNFIRLATCLVLILSFVGARAQQKDSAIVVPVISKIYGDYIPKTGDATQFRYDRVSRLILSFRATYDGIIYASVYDLDPVGNRIKEIDLVFKRDAVALETFYLIDFKYLVFTYDAGDRLTSRKSLPYNIKLLDEAIDEIANRLKQK